MSDATATTARFTRFARWTMAVLLAVIVWGALVRASGSGAGCGSHWPLCNGRVVQRAPSVETLIELSHRLTSGLAMLMVGGLVVLAFKSFPRGHCARRYAGWTLVFMLGEAAVGAGLVLFELVADNASMARAMFMAAHLVNTFFLLGALTLTLETAERGDGMRWRGLWPFAQPGRGLVARLLAPALAGTILLGASGAVAALGDTLFPAGSLRQAIGQDLSASSHLLIRLRLAHPAIAVVVSVWLLLVAAATRRDHDAGQAAAGALAWARRLSVAIFAQVTLGLLNVVLLAPIALQLAHLLVADLLWIALVALMAAVLCPTSTGTSSANAGGSLTATQTVAS